MKWLWAILLALVLSGSVLAGTEKPVVPDPRLDVKVTLEVKHAKLEDVLKQLSDKTHVAFKAGNGARDWKVRERKITVCAKEITAKKLLDEISGLLNYRVTRSGKENEWSYLVWQDKKARDLEDDLVAEEKDKNAERAEKTRQGALDAANQALGMSPEDAMKLQNSNPWLAYLGGTTAGRGFAQLLSALGADFPTETGLMLRGQQVSFPIPDGLGGAAQDASSGGIFGSMRKSGQLPAGMTPNGVTVMQMGDLGGAGAAGLGGMAFITGTISGMDPSALGALGMNGIPMGMFPMSPSDSLVGNAFGQMYFAMDNGASLEDAMNQMATKASDPDVLAESLAHDSPTEKNPPTDPALTREVQLDAFGLDLKKSMQDPKVVVEAQAKVITGISKALDQPVLLESFIRSFPLALFVKAGKQPVYKILIGLEKGGYTWKFDDGTLRIRPEDWALQRSYEIPDSFLEMCKNTLEKQGMFTLDDLAYIVTSLSDDQIRNGLLAEPKLTMSIASLISPIGNSRDILRVYGSLLPQQKAMLTGQGLPFSQLTAPQWDRLQTVITNHLGGVYIADGSIQLKMQAAPKNPLIQKGTPAIAKDAAKSMTDMQTAIFQITVAVSGEDKPRTVVEPVMVFGKNSVSALNKIQKDALDAAAKKQQGTGSAAPTQGAKSSTPSTTLQ
jgi:hypothetical protein